MPPKSPVRPSSVSPPFMLDGILHHEQDSSPLLDVASRELRTHLTGCYLQGRKPPFRPSEVDLAFMERFHLHPHEERKVVSDVLMQMAKDPRISRPERYTLLEFSNMRWNNTATHLTLMMYSLWIDRYRGIFGKFRLLQDLIFRPKLLL